MRLVVIEWVNAELPKPEWASVKDFDPSEAPSVYSVGFIVAGDPHVDAGEEQPKMISLAPNVSGFGLDSCEASGIVNIPSTSIIEITDLEKAELKSVTAEDQTDMEEKSA